MPLPLLCILIMNYIMVDELDYYIQMEHLYFFYVFIQRKIFSFENIKINIFLFLIFFNLKNYFIKILRSNFELKLLQC